MSELSPAAVPEKDQALRPRLRRIGEPLTPAERKIADYLLSDDPGLVFATGRMIARQTGVSAPSVSRFVAKLGYPSFGDLQGELRERLWASLQTPRERLRLDPHRAAGARILTEAFDLASENLRRSLQEIDPEEFEGCIGRLVGSGRIYVVGTHKGRVPALYLASQLGQMRHDVLLLAPSDHLAADILDAHSSDVLVAFVPRRTTPVLEDVIGHFARIGAYLVIIGDHFYEPRIQSPMLLFTLATRGTSAFDSYVALVAFADALVAGVASRRTASASGRMERLEALSARLDRWLPVPSRNARATTEAPEKRDSREESSGDGSNG